MTSTTNEGFTAKSPPSRSRRKWVIVGGLVLLVLFVVGALLITSLNRAIAIANSTGCAQNLRQLGLALKIYADAHDGTLPANWQDLANNTDLIPQAFICPDDYGDGPAAGNTVAAWASHVDQPPGAHCAYIYTGQGTNMTYLQADLLAFEHIGGHQGQGVNLLFADGHVELLSISASTKDRAQYDHILADFAAGVRPLRLRP